MKQLTEIRPKLKENALFLQTESGLFVIRDGPGFHIKGKTIARWISALRPHMNGEHTLAHILARLEPAQREYATQIVSMLLQKEVVKDNEPEDTVSLDDAVKTYFQEQIHYIDHFIQAPHAHFQQFRESDVLLYGAGETLRSLACFLIRNGLRTLALVVTDEPGAYTALLEQEVKTLQANHIETSMTIKSAASQPLPLNDYKTLVYCADNGSLQEIARLNQQCVESGRAFIALTPLPEQKIMLGPFVAAESGPCWLCALLRLSNNSDAQTQATLWREIALGGNAGAHASLSAPLARRIGHGLGFELFKVLSGCLSSETQRAVVLQDTLTLESSASPLLRHPQCPICSQLGTPGATDRLMQVVSGQRDQDPTDEERYQQHERLFDTHTGLFTRFIDEAIEQIPLKGARITARGDIFDQRDDVLAFSLSTPFAAQMQALQRAIASYCRNNIAVVRQASSHLLEEQGEIVIQPQQLATWAGFSTLDEHTPTDWLPAFSSSRKQIVYLPAAAVAPRFNQQGLFERTMAGTISATSFAQLLEQGTLSALTYEYQQQLLFGQAHTCALDLEPLTSDEDLHFLLSSARRFHDDIALSMLETDLPLFVALARVAGQTNGSIGLGLSARDAQRSALQKLVEFFQIQRDMPEHTIDLDERVSTMILADSGTYLASTSAGDFAQLQHALLAAGRDILFVHTTSTDIWEEGTLMSGTVLLTRPQNTQGRS